jgi:hypothetical protein
MQSSRSGKARERAGTMPFGRDRRLRPSPRCPPVSATMAHCPQSIRESRSGAAAAAEVGAEASQGLVAPGKPILVAEPVEPEEPAAAAAAVAEPVEPEAAAVVAEAEAGCRRSRLQGFDVRQGTPASAMPEAVAVVEAEAVAAVAAVAAGTRHPLNS